MQIEKNRFLYGNLSDVGRVRDENQDYYGRYSGTFGDLLLICDGMGGYQGGSIASRMAVEIISEHFKSLTAHYDVKYEIEQAAMQAQIQIKKHQAEKPETEKMGTTLVLLLIREGNYWFAHIGDSRIYLKRDGKTNQLTKDHSLVQEMLDGGIIEPEQAKDHPKGNIITRALGTDNYSPDIKGPYQLKTGDVFMLCSDGMYEYLEHEEISEYMDKEPQDACEVFVALANQRGGKDNITVQVVKISGELMENSSSGKKLHKWIVAIVLAIVALIAVRFIIVRFVMPTCPVCISIKEGREAKCLLPSDAVEQEEQIEEEDSGEDLDEEIAGDEEEEPSEDEQSEEE
ncbi:MAG: Stp1/IreP family PP2C-type Ser/Thr phosphatase [Candidatus Cloacimonadaceae bacterium]